MNGPNSKDLLGITTDDPTEVGASNSETIMVVFSQVADGESLYYMLSCELAYMVYVRFIRADLRERERESA